MRAEAAEGDIAIGGATLATEAAALGLIDEYRIRVLPVLVGGGRPFFPQREDRVNLELIESRTLNSRVGLPPLPRGPLADSSRRAQEGTRQPTANRSTGLDYCSARRLAGNCLHLI